MENQDSTQQSRIGYMTALRILNRYERAAAIASGVEETCPICKNEFEYPVRTCEKHVYCYDCLWSWLGQSVEVNTCPTCRRPLFDPHLITPEDVENHRVAVTITNAGLLSGTFETYGFDQWTSSAVKAAGLSLHDFKLDEAHIVAISGNADVYVCMKAISADMMAIANYTVADRRYTAKQKRDWKLIVERLRRSFEEIEGQTFGGDVFYKMFDGFVLRVQRSLQEAEIDVDQDFFDLEGELDPSHDLWTLLNFVYCGCQKASEKQKKLLAKERMKQELQDLVSGLEERPYRRLATDVPF